MRPLVITQNVTADGAIEMLDDWFDPSHDPPDMHEIMQRDSEACDAILLGRRTFEAFRGYWPAQTDDTTGIKLISAGLVDQYCLWTSPYVQGRGRRLFPAGHREQLSLVAHHAFDSGVTYTRWTSRKD